MRAHNIVNVKYSCTNHQELLLQTKCIKIELEKVLKFWIWKNIWARKLKSYWCFTIWHSVEMALPWPIKIMVVARRNILHQSRHQNGDNEHSKMQLEMKFKVDNESNWFRCRCCVVTNPNITKFTSDYTKLVSSQVVSHSTYVETITAKTTDYNTTSESDSLTVFSGAGFKTESGKNCRHWGTFKSICNGFTKI